MMLNAMFMVAAGASPSGATDFAAVAHSSQVVVEGQVKAITPDPFVFEGQRTMLRKWTLSVSRSFKGDRLPGEIMEFWTFDHLEPGESTSWDVVRCPVESETALCVHP